MPTPWLGHLQWGLASLSYYPQDHQGKTHQKTSCQWHKHSWDPPLPARLNILADAEIHKAYTTCPTLHQAPFLSSTPVALVLNGLHITSNPLSSASMAYYTPIMSAHLKEKHHWSEYIFFSISWLALDKEYKWISTGCWLAAFRLQNGL